MGYVGQINPGAENHRGLSVEIVDKTLAAGTVTLTAADDLELIDVIKDVIAQYKTNGAVAADATDVVVAADGTTATIKGTGTNVVRLFVFG